MSSAVPIHVMPKRDSSFTQRPHDDDIPMAQLAPLLSSEEAANLDATIEDWRDMTVAEFKDVSRQWFDAALDLYNDLGQ